MEFQRQSGPDYLICQYPWNYYYAQVITTNKTIAAVDPETTDPQLQQFLGSGYAYRAFVYLDLARTYEFLPTEFNAGKSPDGKDILGLTVPIVDENTTEDMMRKNPRVSHEAMFEFITSDLTKAIDLLSKGGSPSTKTLPGLQVAYGLMAVHTYGTLLIRKKSKRTQQRLPHSMAKPQSMPRWHMPVCRL